MVVRPHAASQKMNHEKNLLFTSVMKKWSCSIFQSCQSHQNKINPNTTAEKNNLFTLAKLRLVVV